MTKFQKWKILTMDFDGTWSGCVKEKNAANRNSQINEGTDRGFKMLNSLSEISPIYMKTCVSFRLQKTRHELDLARVRKKEISWGEKISLLSSITLSILIRFKSLVIITNYESMYLVRPVRKLHRMFYFISTLIRFDARQRILPKFLWLSISFNSLKKNMLINQSFYSIGMKRYFKFG